MQKLRPRSKSTNVSRPQIYLSPELPAQDHFSGMGQQQREHARRLRRQFNDLALAAELAAAEVEIE